MPFWLHRTNSLSVPAGVRTRGSNNALRMEVIDPGSNFETNQVHPQDGTLTVVNAAARLSPLVMHNLLSDGNSRQGSIVIGSGDW
jgi:hypothetical protein